MRGCGCLLPAVAVMLLLACVGVAGCRTVEYVPVERARVDSVYVTAWSRDSIRVTDSVYVREKGDTVREYRWRYVYRDRAVHDTVFVERCDSVAVPYPVERRLTRWERWKMSAGGWCTGALVTVVLGLLVWMAVRFRRR